MNRRVLIGVIIAVVGIGLIGLGILAINTVLRRSFAPPVVETPIVEETTEIIITTRDLAIGNVITRDDVQTANVPVSLVPRDAILTFEDAVGKISMVHLIQGEMVLQHHLADPTNVSHDIGYIIGPDQVLMAFPAADLMSTLGVLQRGDPVDIFASMTVEISQTNVTVGTGTGEEGEKLVRTFTFDAFQRVQISAIVAEVVQQSSSNAPAPGQQAQPTPNPASVKVKAYLLAMNAQDALVLKHLRDTGATFDIVLRSPTSSELFAISPVTVDYLLQRYELKLPR